jgi:hypothetical protein
MEPDLVDHTPEVDDASDNVVRAAQTFNLHHSSLELSVPWSNRTDP